MKRFKKIFLQVLLLALLLYVSMWVAYWTIRPISLPFSFDLFMFGFGFYFVLLCLEGIVALITSYYLRGIRQMFMGFWTIKGLLGYVMGSCIFVFFMSIRGLDMFKGYVVMRLVYFVLLSLVGFISARRKRKVSSKKTLSYEQYESAAVKKKEFVRQKDKRILVIGMGEAGKKIIRDLRQSEGSINIIGSLDDSDTKKGKYYMGVGVLGELKEVKKVCAEKAVNVILICIESSSNDTISALIEGIDFKRIDVRIIPGDQEQIVEDISYSTMRPLLYEDLIGRKRIYTNIDLINKSFERKRVMITGAGGSIGSEICRQLLRTPIETMVCLCRSEHSLYQLREVLDVENKRQIDIKYYLGNIRDVERIQEIFEQNKPNIMYHAAAHKHVQFMEENEKEAMKVNVFGTKNVLLLSKDYGLEHFIYISTDKAVNPANIMGCSKRMGELLVHHHHQQAGLKTSIVRFGNVMQSRGSVVPLFEKQIVKGGPVTVTHAKAVRYFITIREASLLVLNATALSKGGQTFMLDMDKGIEIDSLVKRMLHMRGLAVGKDIKIVYTGLKKGEKIVEELVTNQEEMHPTLNPKIYELRSQKNDLSMIAQKIQDLQKKLSSMDGKEIRVYIKSIIPEYISLIHKGEQLP